jgi:hypothetical protein
LIAVELPIRRKSDPIHAVATRAAMMDAGVARLMELFAELHAPQRSRALSHDEDLAPLFIQAGTGTVQLPV